MGGVQIGIVNIMRNDITVKNVALVIFHPLLPQGRPGAQIIPAR